MPQRVRDRRGISPMCRAPRWSYVRRVTTARGSHAIVLLLAAGLVGCADDDAETDAEPRSLPSPARRRRRQRPPCQPPPPPRTLLSRRRSSSPSACVTTASRTSPTRRSAPTATSSSALPPTSETRSCRWPTRHASTSLPRFAPTPAQPRRRVTSPRGGSGSCREAIASARTARSSASGCVEANPDKVLVYLQDGGVCFSAETCAPDRGLYNTTVDEGPIGAGGIFDLTDERNPFADYSIVYVPYCTGDAHLGNITTEYAPGLTVHHNGYVNGTAALDHVAATAPDVIRRRRGRRERRLDRRAAVRRARVGSASRRQDHRARGRIGLIPRRAPHQRDHRRLGLRHHHPAVARERQARPPSSGAFRACSSRADGTTPRSSSPATTTPTTSSSSAGTQSRAFPPRISCR